MQHGPQAAGEVPHHLRQDEVHHGEREDDPQVTAGPGLGLTRTFPRYLEFLEAFLSTHQPDLFAEEAYKDK